MRKLKIYDQSMGGGNYTPFRQFFSKENGLRKQDYI